MDTIPAGQNVHQCAPDDALNVPFEQGTHSPPSGPAAGTTRRQRTGPGPVMKPLESAKLRHTGAQQAINAALGARTCEPSIAGAHPRGVAAWWRYGVLRTSGARVRRQGSSLRRKGAWKTSSSRNKHRLRHKHPKHLCDACWIYLQSMRGMRACLSNSCTCLPSPQSTKSAQVSLTSLIMNRVEASVANRCAVFPARLCTPDSPAIHAEHGALPPVPS